MAKAHQFEHCPPQAERYAVNDDNWKLGVNQCPVDSKKINTNPGNSVGNNLDPAPAMRLSRTDKESGYIYEATSAASEKRKA